MAGNPNGPVRTDDADIDALLGETIAKVGESPAVLEASARLQAMLDAAEQEPAPVVDPKTIAMRFSYLKELAKSGAHYLQACQQEEINDSIAIRIGAGFHASLFENRKVLLYRGTRSGKAWERFKARAPEGAVILNEKEWATEMGMITAVRRHDRAMQLLFDGTTRERTILWNRLERPQPCRATPDADAPDRSVELKSTRCSEPRWFAREAVRRFYHAQLGWYDEGIEHERGKRPADSYIVACENVKPFIVTVFRLPAETREVAAKLIRKWWERLLAAEHHNYYGGYVENDVDLELPAQELAEEISFEVDGELVTAS